MLSVSRLGKRFGRVHVLRDITFRCERGEICAIVGENGSGKSTLLAILAGQLEADAGSASLGQVPLLGRSVTARASLGFVPEAANPPGRMTGEQLFGLVAALKAAAPPSDARVRELGLGHVLGQPIASLSLGQRRRLCLAAALVGEPRVLLLDEPSNGLDAGGVDVLVTTLERAASSGTTVILATHDRPLVARLGARVLEIANGRITNAPASGQGVSDEEE